MISYSGPPITRLPRLDRWINGIIGWKHRWRSSSVYLNFYNSIIRLLKTPDAMETIDRKGIDELNDLAPGWWLRGSLKGINQFIEGHRRCRVILRSMIAAVAAERFRLANGRWPVDLNELCPKYLSKVPHDPYDLNPIRYRKLASEIRVYSIGSDRLDGGGEELNAIHGHPGDLGVRIIRSSI